MNQKSSILHSLECIESLGKLYLDASVNLGRDSIGLSIVSECVFVKKLLVEAIIRHQEYCFIDKELDGDVDCKDMIQRLRRISDTIAQYSYAKRYNENTLSLISLYRYLHTNSTGDIYWLKRDCKPANDSEEFLERINLFSSRYFDFFSQQSQYLKNKHRYVEQVDDNVCNDVIEVLKHKPKSDEIRIDLGLVQIQASNELKRVVSLLITLSELRAPASVPSFMYEEFATIQFNEYLSDIMQIVCDVDDSIHFFNTEVAKDFLQEKITQLRHDKEDIYSAVMMDSFLTPPISENVYRPSQYVIYGPDSRTVILNLENVGRFAYCLGEKQKFEEMKSFMLFIFRIAYMKSRLTKMDNPYFAFEWEEESKAVFKQSVVIDGVYYDVNIGAVNKIVKAVAIHVEHEYQWTALALFAKSKGFLHEGKYNSSAMERLLHSYDWEINVAKSSMSPYNFLVDSFVKGMENRLSSIKLPKVRNKNRCNKNGVSNIQTLLNAMFELPESKIVLNPRKK